MEKYNLKEYFREEDLKSLKEIQENFESLFYKVKKYNDILIKDFHVNIDEDTSFDSLFEELESYDNTYLTECEDNIKTWISTFNKNLNNILFSYLDNIENYLYETYKIKTEGFFKLTERDFKLYKSGILSFLRYEDVLEKYLDKVLISKKDKLEDIGYSEYCKRIKYILNCFTNTKYLNDYFKNKNSYSHRVYFNINNTFSSNANKEIGKIYSIFKGKPIYDNINLLEVSLEMYLDQDSYEISDDDCILIISQESVMQNSTIAFKDFEKLYQFMIFLGYKYNKEESDFYLPTSNRRTFFT